MAENYSEVPQKSVPPPASPIITGPSARPPDPFTNSVGENGPKGASDDSKKLFEIARDDNISCSGSAVSEPYSSVPPPPGQFWGGGHRASGGGQRHWGGSHHHPPVVVSGHGGGANHHQGYHRGMSAASEPTYPSRPIVEDPEVLHLPSGMRRTPSTLGREGEYIAPRSHRGKRMGVFTSGGDSQGMLLCTHSELSPHV